MRPLSITLLMSICGIITIIFLTASKADAHRQTSDPLSREHIQQWSDDIDFLQQELERRHIHLYHTIAANLFKSELTRIQQQLPSLTETGLTVELMRLIKKVGDGHTQFAYWGGEYHRYPIELRVFDDELRVIQIGREHRHLLGSSLVAIDDISIEKVRALLTPILQGVENSHSEKQRLSENITVAEVLHGLKISAYLNQVKFTVRQLSGELRHVHLRSLTPDQFRRLNLVSLAPAQPEGFVRENISIEGIDLLLGKNGDIAYLDFHHYPRMPAMRDFAEDLINVLRTKKTRNLIIDLRNNSGGDFFVGLHLAWAFIMVDNLNWRDGIYVLIGRKTFSAAMSNAAQYRQLLNATLVGEATGANPVGYQDAGSFALPNSGWNVMHSKRFYRFQDSESGGVAPDIKIELDWNSYRAGKDNQLEWILNTIKSHRQAISPQ